MFQQPMHINLLGNGTLQVGGFWAGLFRARRTIFDPPQSGTNATYVDAAHLNPGSTVGSVLFNGSQVGIVIPLP